MASRKWVFVLIFLVLHYLTQNAYAQKSSDPDNGGTKNAQGSSYRDWLYKTNELKGNEENSGSSPSGTESPGSRGSENSSGQEDSSDSGTSGNNNPTESSNTDSNEEEKKNKTDFKNEPPVNQVIDFVLNPVAGATEIFLKVLRRSGAAVIESTAEISSNLAVLASKVVGVFQEPSQILNLTKDIGSGSVQLARNVGSRFRTIAVDAANETRLGLAESIAEGRILAGTVGQLGINATKIGTKGVTKGATGTLKYAVNATKNFIVKDCVWYRVGFTDNCIPFRIWKIVQFPFKAALLPVKLAIDAALLPITFPIYAALLPIKLGFNSVKLGGTLGKGVVKGTSVGLKVARATAPSVISGIKSGIELGGQVGARLLYHGRRFIEILRP